MPILPPDRRARKADKRSPTVHPLGILSKADGVWPPLALLLVTVLSAVLVPLSVFGETDTTSPYVFTALDWGNGPGQVGLVKATEGLTRGPEALAVALDGRVAILDSVNHRLVLLDQEGAPLGLIPLPLTEPRFLAVDDRLLYVLDADADRRIVTYDWSGQLTEQTSVPQSDEVVTGLFATAAGACVEFGHRQSLLMTQIPQGPDAASADDPAQPTPGTLPGRPVGRETTEVVSATFHPRDGLLIQTRAMDKAGSALGEPMEIQPHVAEGRAIDHLVSVDTDGHGGLLIGARLLRPEKHGETTYALAITWLPADQISLAQAKGAEAQERGEDVLLLEESDFAYLGDPYTVAPDGRVFQPIADAGGYTILIHSFEGGKP